MEASPLFWGVALVVCFAPFLFVGWASTSDSKEARVYRRKWKEFKMRHKSRNTAKRAPGADRARGSGQRVKGSRREDSSRVVSVRRPAGARSQVPGHQGGFGFLGQGQTYRLGAPPARGWRGTQARAPRASCA